jgi:hypothetical protein
MRDAKKKVEVSDQDERDLPYTLSELDSYGCNHINSKSPCIWCDRDRATTEALEKLKDLMRRDDELQDMQRHGVYTPEQMQHAWDVHRKEWEEALKED